MVGGGEVLESFAPVGWLCTLFELPLLLRRVGVDDFEFEGRSWLSFSSPLVKALSWPANDDNRVKSLGACCRLGSLPPKKYKSF